MLVSSLLTEPRRSPETRKKQEREDTRFPGAQTPPAARTAPCISGELELCHTHHPTVSAHTHPEATSSLCGSSTQQHRGPFNTQTYPQPSRPDRPLTPCTNYSTHAPHRPLPHDRATNPLATCMQLDNYLIHALQDSATPPDAPLVAAAGLAANETTHIKISANISPLNLDTPCRRPPS